MQFKVTKLRPVTDYTESLSYFNTYFNTPKKWKCRHVCRHRKIAKMRVRGTVLQTKGFKSTFDCDVGDRKLVTDFNIS